MSGPTLSIYMPNFNHAAYLPQAIEAIVGQSRPPDEFLIADDASSDESAEIIESYARRYASIRFIRHTQNRGAVATIDELVKECRCDYLYGAAADDFVLPGFFEAALKAAADFPQAGIVFGKLMSVDDTGRKPRDVQAPPWESTQYVSPARFLTEYLDRQPPYRSLSTSTIYRRDCLAEVGWFRPQLGHWCDTFAIRAIALKYGAAYVPQPFAVWRKLAGSLSQGSQSSLRKNQDIVDFAASLMRSPEFSDRFSEAHVERWSAGYRRANRLLYLRAIARRSLAGLIDIPQRLLTSKQSRQRSA
ncbi:MAG: hypothetical protein C0483_02905 [Pirellula sp.]|nr:hypothetical protein [Pirellula sp.]